MKNTIRENKEVERVWILVMDNQDVDLKIEGSYISLIWIKPNHRIGLNSEKLKSMGCYIDEETYTELSRLVR